MRKNEPNQTGEGIKNVVSHPTGGNMAIGNPADTLTYVRALGLIVGGYGAYPVSYTHLTLPTKA